MLTEFEFTFMFSITPEEALANLIAALLCGVFIAILYRATYNGISYSGSYVVSLIMLALITALVIMVIGNNLARAFGLVGAMSIIRFRTAVKDTQDIMFIFFSLAVGLACGAGMYAISITGTVFIGLVVYLTSVINLSSPAKKEYLLQLIYGSSDKPDADLGELLKKYCRKSKLVNLKTFGENDSQMSEYSYYIVMKSQRKALEFTTQLQSLKNLKKVNVFFDET